MFWKITKDHINDGSLGIPSRVGKGRLPRIYVESELSALIPFKFKIYDDDDNLYYEGVSSDRSSENAFLPLDWAMHDAGATRIDYLQDNGKWETL